MLQLMAEWWGNKKVPVVAVIGVLVILASLHKWADVHYLEIAAGADKALEDKLEERSTRLELKIDANSMLLRQHIQGYEINENRKAIELVQNQQFELSQFEAANGSNAMLEERKHQLNLKLDELKERRECLTHEDVVCE